MSSKVVPIPEPPGTPFIGNIGEFKSEDSIQDINRLHDKYGDLYRLRFPGGKGYIFVGSQKLVNEVCDESRFQKSVKTELGEVRHLANDGLFTAKAGEENWEIAHRVLMPAFGPVAIRGMFDEMHDVAAQLVLKWARHGPSTPILTTDDFTRLALDTIALCSMDFRFNSFYRDDLHPFVDSMGDVLIESGKRYARPGILKVFYRATTKKYFSDIQKMREISDEIVQARRADPENKKKDLLSAMMNGVDTKTGKKMSDSSITDNLITFLVAGHETTSGTLSFLFYHLLKNPECYQKAQQEVDEIMGRGPITVDKIFKLKYIPAALRETLRLASPIPGITVEALEDTLLNSKYPVKKGEVISPFFSRSHLDPLVFGSDANVYVPDRMLDENFNRLQKEFPNCWKPFGNGVRGCIGRPFAWQEMLLVVSLLLQNFNFVAHDPSYKLGLVETLTIKPKAFAIRASLRHGMSALELERRLRGSSDESATPQPGKLSSDLKHDNETTGNRMSIFYGSNSGTCEALAQRLALDAASHNFYPTVVESLDLAKEKLPVDQPVVIITCSYEGQPPDNAANFTSWLQSLTGKPLEHVPYAVFGVGNREWANTFHRIPKLIDTTLEERGAQRMCEMGLSDTLDGNTFADFESWEDSILWPSLEKRFSSSAVQSPPAYSSFSVEVSSPRSSILRQEVNKGFVTTTKDISGPGVPVKKHIEVELPTGTSYRVGDYLCVLPTNPPESVSRVLRYFKISSDVVLKIQGDKRVGLPVNEPASAGDIFGSYVELSQPATRRNILKLAESSQVQATKSELERLCKEGLQEEIAMKRISVMDLLERFPDIDLPLGTFLSMLPSMRVRQYSISSSPLKDPNRVSISYSVLSEPALSGQGRHIGVATSYLSSLAVRDRVYITVRPSHVAFHLPLTPESTPIICLAAGSGIGPFRGFIQERSVQLASGRTLAPAMLFFGCRGKADDLYREEFDEWEKQGAVIVKRAYSRESSKETAGCKYVQDRLLKEKKEVGELWDRGAKLFVCGSRAVGNSAEKACIELLMELKGMDYKGAKAFLEEIRNDRFATDVFE